MHLLAKRKRSANCIFKFQLLKARVALALIGFSILEVLVQDDINTQVFGPDKWPNILPAVNPGGGQVGDGGGCQVGGPLVRS